MRKSRIARPSRWNTNEHSGTRSAQRRATRASRAVNTFLSVAILDPDTVVDRVDQDAGVPGVNDFTCLGSSP